MTQKHTAVLRTMLDITKTGREPERPGNKLANLILSAMKRHRLETADDTFDVFYVIPRALAATAQRNSPMDLFSFIDREPDRLPQIIERTLKTEPEPTVS